MMVASTDFLEIEINESTAVSCPAKTNSADMLIQLIGHTGRFLSQQWIYDWYDYIAWYMINLLSSNYGNFTASFYNFILIFHFTSTFYNFILLFNFTSTFYNFIL
jgi:hypothetical protein